MFQITGAMAEFERALIQERVRAGLRNARAKGIRRGRRRIELDVCRVLALRASAQKHAFGRIMKTTPSCVLPFSGS